MKPRPLYRWKSFWFGVLVIAFLGWAWVWSMRRIDFVEWRRITAKQASGEVVVMWGLDLGEAGASNYQIPYPSRSSLPPAFSSSELQTVDPFSGGLMPYGRHFVFAHWFLILLFVVPWSGWLAWRWRRINRLRKMEPNA